MVEERRRLPEISRTSRRWCTNWTTPWTQPLCPSTHQWSRHAPTILRMITVGIDLASQDIGTAMCELEWSEGRARIMDLRVGVSDAQIAERTGNADKLGIDVPLGWPSAFVDAVTQHAHDGSWPPQYQHSNTLSVRYRRTDLVTWESMKGHPRSRFQQPRSLFLRCGLPHCCHGWTRGLPSTVLESLSRHILLWLSSVGDLRRVVTRAPRGQQLGSSWSNSSPGQQQIGLCSGKTTSRHSDPAMMLSIRSLPPLLLVLVPCHSLSR